MNTFTSDIQKFITQGEFTNNFDESSNIVLLNNPVRSNQRYMSYELTRVYYDDVKITELYNLSTIDLVSTGASSTVEEELRSTNSKLKEELESLIQSNESSSVMSDLAGSKDVIIDLRIKLSEGKSISDFSPEFPYPPL
jgi:hypothetical protein